MIGDRGSLTNHNNNNNEKKEKKNSNRDKKCILIDVATPTKFSEK